MTDVQTTDVVDPQDGPVVSPQATTPITVGELTDVPQPGSLVAAGWAVEVSDRIIHRFPNVAAMQTWAAANGAMAYAEGDHWRRAGGQWNKVTDATALGAVKTTADSALATATTANNAAYNAGVTANAANVAAANAQAAANNAQNGVNFLNGQVRQASQGALTNISTDGNGDARISFMWPYNSTPGVSAVAYNAANIQIVIHSVDANGFTIRAHFAAGNTAPNNPWSGATTIGWTAAGAWIA